MPSTIIKDNEEQIKSKLQSDIKDKQESEIKKDTKDIAEKAIGDMDSSLEQGAGDIDSGQAPASPRASGGKGQTAPSGVQGAAQGLQGARGGASGAQSPQDALTGGQGMGSAEGGIPGEQGALGGQATLPDQEKKDDKVSQAGQAQSGDLPKKPGNLPEGVGSPKSQVGKGGQLPQKPGVPDGKKEAKDKPRDGSDGAEELGRGIGKGGKGLAKLKKGNISGVKDVGQGIGQGIKGARDVAKGRADVGGSQDFMEKLGGGAAEGITGKSNPLTESKKGEGSASEKENEQSKKLKEEKNKDKKKSKDKKGGLGGRLEDAKKKAAMIEGKGSPKEMSEAFLKGAWKQAIPSFTFSVFYVYVHVFLRLIFPKKFCKLGHEWVPRKIKRSSPERAESIGNRIGVAERGLVGCCCFLHILAIIGSIVMILLTPPIVFIVGASIVGALVWSLF